MALIVGQGEGRHRNRKGCATPGRCRLGSVSSIGMPTQEGTVNALMSFLVLSLLSITLNMEVWKVLVVWSLLDKAGLSTQPPELSSQSLDDRQCLVHDSPHD